MCKIQRKNKILILTLKTNKMKKFTLTVTLMMAITIVISQPSAFKYQTVVRDASGEIMANQAVSFKISILQGSSSGTNIYTETHTTTTNQFGLVTLNIGEELVVSGGFETINWGNDNYFLQIEVYENGGSNYQLIGVSQLLAVPFALHAASADQSKDNDWLKNGDDLYLNVKGNVGVGTENPMAM
jgi:hypothetical protein